jgi:hypothetical protein
MQLPPCFSLFLFLSLFLFSCGKPLPELTGVDRALWMADKRACSGSRAGMLEAVKTNTPKLLALSEVDLVSLLGRPDEEELYKRNQKFYYYYLEPHGECATADSTIKALRVAIRFNAMGLAKEVRIEKNY